MSTRSRIPPLLDSVISLPEESSLLVITGVVNAAQHWLITRFLSRLLGARTEFQNEDGAGTEGHEEDTVGVVMVSWMRDLEYWRLEARRGAGVDLSRMADQGRFAFVDGLTHLFAATEEQAKPGNTAVTPTGTSPARKPAPARSPAPHRGASTISSPLGGPASPTAASSTPTPKPPTAHSLLSPSLTQSSATILSAIAEVQQRNKHVFLILDSPTLLLATQPSLTPHDLTSFLLSLRAQAHSTLVSLEADGPLLSAAAPGSFDRADDYTSGPSGTRHRLVGAEAGAVPRVPTPLEAAHAAFVVGLVHTAAWVTGVRPLDTGAARDVTGVLTVRRGGAWDGGQEGLAARDGGGGVREMEVLYRVGMDGAVKVFERGGADLA